MTAQLPDLWDELQRGRIYECSLRSSKWVHDGLQVGEQIYIDPRPAILETLLHELIHRRHPRWGEKKVAREARVLIRCMSDSELRTWWVKYQQIKRKSVPVEVED